MQVHRQWASQRREGAGKPNSCQPGLLFSKGPGSPGLPVFQEIKIHFFSLNVLIKDTNSDILEIQWRTNKTFLRLKDSKVWFLPLRDSQPSDNKIGKEERYRKEHFFFFLMWETGDKPQRKETLYMQSQGGVTFLARTQQRAGDAVFVLASTSVDGLAGIPGKRGRMKHGEWSGWSCIGGKEQGA